MPAAKRRSIVKWKWVFILGWILAGIALVIAAVLNVVHHIEGAQIWRHSDFMMIAFVLGTIGISMVLGSLREDQKRDE